MKKKIVSTLLCAALAVSLMACGGSSSSEPAAEAPAAEEAATEEAAPAGEAAAEATAEAPAAEGGEKYGIVLKTLSSEFWQSVQQGIEDKAAELGVEVTVQGANSEDDVEGQNNILETMVQSGEYVAFAVAPLSDANLVNTIADANSQGYLVADIDEHVNLDTLSAQGGAVVSFVTSDNKNIGNMAGSFIADQLAEGDEVAIIEGKAGAVSGEDRRDGCREAFEAKGLNIVDSQPADWDKTKAYDLATNLLSKNPDLKAIYCCNDTMAMGAYQAVFDSGKDVIVVGTDGNADAIDSVKGGGLTATIAQDSAGVGARSLELLVNAYRNGEKPGEVEMISEFVDPILITKD